MKLRLSEIIENLHEWLDIIVDEPYSLMMFPYFLPGGSKDDNWKLSMDIIIRLYKSRLIEPIPECGVLNVESANALFNGMAKYEPSELGDSPWFKWEFIGTESCRALVARFPVENIAENSSQFLSSIENIFSEAGLPWGVDTGFHADTAGWNKRNLSS